MADQGSVRAPSAVPVDDTVLPFEVSALDVRGRLTKMGPALDEILTRHDYPPQVGKLLGEAIVHSPDRTLRGGANEILRGIVAKTLVAS